MKEKKSILDSRTKILFKNIGLISIYRTLSIVLNLLTVPVLIRILGTNDYGIWIALSSVLAWMNFFDFGISQNLQNKIASTLALGKLKETKILVSSTYMVISLLMFTAFIILSIISTNVDWATLLNAEQGKSEVLKWCALIILGSVASQIILKLVSSVLFAYQKTNLIEFIGVINQIVTLLATIYLSKLTILDIPILAVAIIYGVIPFIIWLCSNIIFFKFSFKLVSPSVPYIKVSKFGNILKSSSNFFVLQIYSLVLFQTDNIIVANLFNPSYVTTFSLTTKYYSMITVLSSVMLLPLWSAISEAYANHELQWIKDTLNKKLLVWFGLVVLGILMFSFAEELIGLWTQTEIKIPSELSILMMMYTLVLAYNNIFGIILNAASKFRIQILIVSVVVVTNVPLAYLLVKGAGMGISGVVLANLICVVCFGIIITWQALKLLNGNAKGVWAR